MPKPQKTSYDLARQPCIPVTDAQGVSQLLSLGDALAAAHTLREIQHNSPLVVASVLRLLVAVLTDIHSLTRSSQWAPLWTKGAFDSGAINDYFERNWDRFDLFHDRYPFYQCAALEDDAPINLKLLSAELSSGNNPTLFDHSLDTVERDYSPVDAFYLLLATQNFALAGLLRRTTRLRGEAEPIYWQSAYGGPLIPGAMIWLTGDDLFETLWLNVAPLDVLDGETEDELDETDQDMPIWRQDRPELLRDRKIKNIMSRERPRGTRDRLTFQSRLIRLQPEWSDGRIVVRRAAFNQGRSLDATAQHSFDPMLAYHTSKKEGYVVSRLSHERASWRDTHALIGLNTRTGTKLDSVTPRALHTLHGELEDGTPGISPSRTLRLNVAGLANDQAKILLWRHDRLDVPADALCNKDTADRIGSLLKDAEEVAYNLRAATRRLCELFLAPGATDPRGNRVEGAMKADTDRVTAIANAIDSRPTYWACLESAFQRLLLELPGRADGAANDWKDTVQQEASAAFEAAVEKLGESPSSLKAAVLARPRFIVPSRLEPQALTTKSKSRAKESSP